MDVSEKYTIIHHIGKGYFNSVYLGYSNDEKKVAIKKIWNTNKEKSEIMWKQDIRLYNILCHLPSVPKLLDYWSFNNDFNIVVEYIEGEIDMSINSFLKVFGKKPDIAQLKEMGYYDGLKDLIYSLALAEIKYNKYYRDVKGDNFLYKISTKKWYTIDIGSFCDQNDKSRQNFLRFFQIVLNPITKQPDKLKKELLKDICIEHEDFRLYYAFLLKAISVSKTKNLFHR